MDDQPDDKTTTDESVEFDQFEQLAKKLLTVPKKELDEARAKEQATKPQG